MLFFPLTWHIEGPTISCYGWLRDTEKQRLIPSSVAIEDFRPYLYIKLPQHIQWNSEKVDIIKRHLANSSIKFITPDKDLVYKQGIYSFIRAPPTPYLYLEFYSQIQRHRCIKFLQTQQVIPRLGALRLHVCEAKATPILQLTCARKISTIDWFEFLPTNAQGMLTTKWNTLSKPTQHYPMPSPVVMSFDIEVYSHNPKKLPDAQHTEDKIFQISHVFSRLGSGKYEKILFTLGKPAELEPDIQVVEFTKESEMLLAHAALIRSKKPQILMGYNIYNFDIPYMLDRAEYYMIKDDFIRQGATLEKCPIISTEWSSSAFSNHKTFCLDMKGRICVDLLPMVKKDHKLPNYKLDNVAFHFLKKKKDPVSALDIFAFYKESLRSEADGMPCKYLAMIGNYCVKDAMLPLELFEYHKFWFNLASLASICQLPVMDLYRYGQQLKVYSQIYRYCYAKDIVVEDKLLVYNGEQCKGASVIEPTKGLHEDVVSFDFASLYPSAMISHNIDYTTLVPEEEKDVADEECWVIEWEEHINCSCPQAEKGEKEVLVCQKYCYKWLKEPKGVIPNIVENLLSERKVVKTQMKSMDEDSDEYALANTRQLNLKLSANSAYGFLNAKTSPLMFFAGAMSITAIGRRSIRQVKQLMWDKYKGTVVYGDTDSAYVKFPLMKGLATDELCKRCCEIASEVSSYFPKPMKLEFEGKVFKLYLLLSKKWYIFRTHKSDKLEGKGVLLVRRDNCDYVRRVYSSLTEMIFSKTPEVDLYIALAGYCGQMLSGYGEMSWFEYTKSVKKVDSFKKGDKSELKITYGDYTISKLNEDPKKRDKQMKLKNATTPEEFYIRSLPAHVQLALKMKERGQPVENGSRLNYVVTLQGGIDAQAWMKYEDSEYFNQFLDRRFIDTFFYVSHLLTPVQSLYEVYLDKDCKTAFKVLERAVRAKFFLLEALREAFGVRLIQ